MKLSEYLKQNSMTTKDFFEMQKRKEEGKTSLSDYQRQLYQEIKSTDLSDIVKDLSSNKFLDQETLTYYNDRVSQVADKVSRLNMGDAKSNKSFLAQCFIVGFAVGIDGAIGNFSLALMGINAFYVPLIIALTHGVMILLSVLLCKTNLFSKISKYQFVPALLLILLGLYKTIGFFI